MPTPIGHSLASIVIRFLGRGSQTRYKGLSWLQLIVLANLPDLDFIPGYFTDNPRAYHWGPTHSFATAVLVGIIIGGIIGRRCGGYAAPIVLSTAVYASHILLDLLIRHGPNQAGLQVFWPFSARRFFLPWSVFKSAPATIAQGPFAAIFSLGIFPVIAQELLVMLPVVALAWLFARGRALLIKPDLAGELD